MFNSPIKDAPPPDRPIKKKEIYWGSQEGGNKFFPAEIRIIVDRRHSDFPTPLLAFGKAVANAQERVWIVDEYLFMPDIASNEPPKKKQEKIDARIESIINWLHKDLVANDIRFLTKHHEEVTDKILDLFEDQANYINSHNQRRAGTCVIQIKDHLTKHFNYMHDRFAIIDDELWHFGGTVGGFHASVSAASRGWCANEHGAIDFFKMAWNARDK